MKMLIVMLFFVYIKTLHLSPKQMYSARGLLMNPTITQPQRESIQKILYNAHEKWAIKKAVEFKKFHRYKCRDISADELILSSKIGLLKSSRKYNGRSLFTKFSEIYVKSELLRTLTIRLSMTSCISMKDRMKSNRTESIRRTVTAVNHILKSDMQTPIMNSVEKEFYRTAWEYVNELDVFTKRIVWLKYDYEFKTQRSNRILAELMCCSEETVRKAITRFSDEMRQEVLYTYTSV
jgi:hypothetical protein